MKLRNLKGVRRVSDADDKMKVQLYNQLTQAVRRYLKSMYPTCPMDVEDVANEIYVGLLRPKTPKKYRDMLKEEDAAKGTTHSKEWYMYEQTKYPKVVPFDWFDPEKSNIGQYASSQAIQGISDLMKQDDTLRYNPETKKYEKIAKMSSMDDTHENEEGEAISAARTAADKVANVSQRHDTIDVNKWIKLLYDKTPAERGAIVKSLRKALASDVLSGADRRAYERILEACDNEEDEPIAPTINRVSGTERVKRGEGNFAKYTNFEDRLNDKYPFDVEPKVVEQSDHTSRLKFTFVSRAEAEEAAKKYESEMDAKGLQLIKVRGTSLLYGLK